MSDIVKAGGLALTKTRIALLQAIKSLNVQSAWNADVWHGVRVTARVTELRRAGLVELGTDHFYQLTPAGEAALKAVGGAS